MPPLVFAAPPHYSDLPLDRAGHLRSDTAEMQRLVAAPSSRVLLLHQGKLLVAPAADADPSSTGGNGGGSLALQPHSFAAAGATAPGGGPPRWLPLVASSQQLAELAAPTGQQQGEPAFLFLGLDAAGDAVFAALVPPFLLSQLPPLPSRDGSPADQPAAAAAATVPAGLAWVDVRNGGAAMCGPDAAVSALAAGLVQWHASAAFCSRTGARLVRRPALYCWLHALTGMQEIEPGLNFLTAPACCLALLAGFEQWWPLPRSSGSARRQRQTAAPGLPPHRPSGHCGCQARQLLPCLLLR